MMARGSIRQRGGSWQARLYVGVGPDGRRRYATRSAPSRRDAERALAEMVLAAGRDLTVPATMTVAELAERWIAMLAAQGRSPHTLADYRSKLRHWVLPALGAMRVADVTPARADAVLAAVMSTPSLTTGRPHSASTVSGVRRVMRAMWGQAVRWEIVGRNPIALTATYAAQTPHTPHLPDVTALPAVLAAADADSPRTGLLVRLAIVTSCRRGELAALRWGDYDSAVGTLTVARTIVRDGGALVERATKTRQTKRLRLDPHMRAALDAWRADREMRAAIGGYSVAGDGWILSAMPDGTTPPGPDSLTHAWHRVRRTVGLDAVRLHDLRHFGASFLLASGVGAAQVAAHVGHTDATTTLRVYAHVLDGGDVGAAMLGALIAPDS